MKTSKFKMTELGPIPEDWEVAEISDLYEVRSSKRVFQSQWRSSGIPFYRARDIVGFRHGEQAIGGLFIDKALYEKYKRDYGVPSIDDLLVTAVGTLGSIFRVSNESPFYFKDGNIIWFKSKGKYDSRLLEVLFESGFLDSQIYDTAGGSTVGTYTISNAKKTLVPLPPLAEQRRIARALSDVDELIFALGKLIEKKRNIKTGAMQELLTGKKRLPGFGGKCRQESLETEDFNAEAQRRRGSECKMAEVGFIPVDWKVKRLGDVGSFSKGAGISRAQANSGKIPAVRYGELYTTHHNYIKRFESFISDEVAKESTQLTYGDIVFACSGETKEEIGKCAAFLGSEVAYAGGDLIILSPRTGYDSKFLAFELNAPYCALQKAAAGQGDAVVHIRRESLENLIVVVPSLAEQKAIAEVLSDMDAEIGELEAQKAKFESIKQGMMQELLTGKIRLV